MNRRVFNQLIAESDFRELFISELGWNNPHGQTDFEMDMDDSTYHFEQIAERNGFQVLTCEAKSIPPASLCKKIDTRLRRSANDYICIFYIPNSSHHLWAVPVKKVEKRDIVLVEYANADAAGFLFEKVESFAFDLDEKTTITDVVGRVHSAFIINSEKITKDFYTGFKKEHAIFAKFISGIDDHIADKDNRNKQWYTSVMLNRLMFCYFIQKKGFLDGDVDYLRHKLEWHREQTASRSLKSTQPTFFTSFYKGFLRTLFHGGLNAPKHDSTFEDIYGRIPYLNGGMFDVHQLELDYKDLDIADDAFISLFDFFDKWHWHLDDRITATGRDINPDVLGYIFEQYINDRAQMGAYYTKEDITEYIGRNTILPYLMETTLGGCASVGANNDLPLQTPWEFLQKSGDRYIFDAVKKGVGLEIPEEIAIGLDTTKPNLLERRKRWNDRTPERFALPTEIWRETIERLKRYESVKSKIENGEIRSINDFITYNLDIRSFVYDLLNTTDDPQLIKRFYAELQKITILDPTCGSGAFLFAALNILEPLYEVCITRMQEFQQQYPDLFGMELDEIMHQYRSNIQYFIYKSIILRNLYGVDIMVEATEIAKLRLFLKMVAVVDVDKRDKNLGLDPLPDIDFNIRCGNTLVGYATEKALEDDLDYGDPFAAAELRPLIQEKMGDVAEAYRKFKELQLIQTEEPNAFKRVKDWLKEHLSELNDLLNRKLYQSTTSEEIMTYEQWLCSHQPFHWLAEFYEIINDHGGFDVIIGNPPYVEYNKKVKGVAVSDIYKLTGYKTITCGNLYAYCIERSKIILRDKGVFGMIVPLSLTCGNRMDILRNLVISSFKSNFFANFEIFPSKLFDGAFQRISILLSNNQSETAVSMTTKLHRWYSVERINLFSKIRYTTADLVLPEIGIAKFNTSFHSSVLNKIISYSMLARLAVKSSYDDFIYYQEATNYWMKAAMRVPFYRKNGIIETPPHGRKLFFRNETDKRTIFGLINSSLFYIWYIAFSDGFHLSDNVVKRFPVDSKLLGNHNVLLLSDYLQSDIDSNSFTTTRNTAEDDIEIESFKVNASKKLIDKIDKELAKHYGFTEEELDFIINYDIKYRMGDELNEED